MMKYEKDGHAVTRLLAAPHFRVPLPPPRNDAARAHKLGAGLAEDCFPVACCF